MAKLDRIERAKMRRLGQRRRWSRSAYVSIFAICLSVTFAAVNFALLSKEKRDQVRNYLRMSREDRSDIAYNTGWRATPPSIADAGLAEKGRGRMLSSRAAIVGLVGRGDECAFNHFAPQIEHLASMFESADIVLIVPPIGDDALSQRLLSWQGERTEGNFLIPEHAGEEDYSSSVRYECGEGCRELEGTGCDCKRFRRIGAFRNQALLELRRLEEARGAYDFVISIDPDLWGIDPRGVAESFSFDGWNAICANGVMAHGMYWDTIAFRDARGREIGRLDIQAYHDKARRGAELIPVASCFGGMTIYRRSAMAHCRYLQGWEAGVAVNECEHVSFNKCVLANGNGSGVYSNARMKSYYGPHHLLRKDFPEYTEDWWCDESPVEDFWK